MPQNGNVSLKSMSAKKIEAQQDAHKKFKAERHALAQSVAQSLKRDKEFPLPEDFDKQIETKGWAYAEKMAGKYLNWKKASRKPAKNVQRKTAKPAESDLPPNLGL